MNEAPNCWQCRHFKVSWDPNFPYACDTMGFKSHILPCIEVLRADGHPCRAFEPKATSPTTRSSPS
ncbi:MAG: uracil-DNA glycosylase [Gammaproteobacteria bacterium]|nr:uracil-DNA glycosylase [Gammaproteobacteria bacterium]